MVFTLRSSQWKTRNVVMIESGSRRERDDRRPHVHEEEDQDDDDQDRAVSKGFEDVADR
jgi:hypothetical protein